MYPCGVAVAFLYSQNFLRMGGVVFKFFAAQLQFFTAVLDFLKLNVKHLSDDIFVEVFYRYRQMLTVVLHKRR